MYLFKKKRNVENVFIETFENSGKDFFSIHALKELDFVSTFV